MIRKQLKIAVDFDGTIVEHRYPAIGEEILFAFETLKALQRQGHLLVLWTFRCGPELDQAVEYCKENGVVFYAVNKSYPDEIMDDTISRKIDADLYIDDRNFGGFPGWSSIWENMSGDSYNDNIAFEKFKEKSLLQKIKDLFGS
jgi:hypothetical protein